MFMFRLMAVLFLTLFIQAATYTRFVHSAENKCSDWMNKRLSQTDMNACSRQATEAERLRLQRLLEELRKKFISDKNQPQWQRLEGNQKEWEQWVRKDCQWESAFSEGGSVQPTIYALCMANATANRIDRLRIFLCEGEGRTGECDRARAYEIKNETPRR